MQVRPLALAALLGCASLAAWSAPTFESCAASVDARPTEYEPYRCYFEVAAATGEWQTASRKLERLAAGHPRVDWIVFVRAVVASSTDAAAAERLYLEAARRFESAGNVRGEVLARANLQSIFYQSGRIASAAQQVERVTALAARADDAETRTRARVVAAEFHIATGTNLGSAQRALQQATADLEAVPAYWLRRLVLQNHGNVLLLLGQYDQAVIWFARLLREAQAQQDLDSEARARLSIVNALVVKRGEEPHAVDAARLFADAGEALSAARRAQDVDLELEALRLVSETFMVEQPGRAREYNDACVSRARSSKRWQVLSNCLWVRARLLARTDPVAAQTAIDSAIELLHYDEGADHNSLAHAWIHAMRLAWQTQTPDAAIATGKQALVAIERLRTLQSGAQSRAAAFSAWTQDYYWLSGRILHLSGTDRRPELVDEAFQIAERMRARSLLDLLSAAPVLPADRDEAAVKRREAVLASIVDVNRKLLQSRGPDRAALLQELDALERQELELREQRDRLPVAATPVSLPELRRSLAPNEAMLAFQTGARAAADRDGGGAWLFVITPGQARVIELPDRHELGQMLALFKGLMRQSADDREPAGSALHARLLANALDGLEGVDRLIVVPDLPFDTFPLSALGAARGAAPLAARYEIVLVPSATIWHEWRRRPAPARDRTTLVLADPKLEFAAALATERSLAPLPHARAEGLETLERLDGRGTLWTGSEASEGALKALDLSVFGILHFAAHAVIDAANPDRSAILLSNGTDEQDGLLQGREIADLRLDGQLVVLSSCQSATGAQVRGEGVLGVARSFFVAGARTVIGSLWPVRDDHARAFFDRFYASLAEGHPVGDAFHQAQRRLIEDGLPMEAWAGFVLMGDPDARPVRAESSARSTPRIAFAVMVLVLLAAIAIARYFLHRSRRPARAG